ncbi:hypothetical protein [Desulfosporosinus hippei]|uniref:Uncharacterized protein n=1 Tax=Desulfosporosinus hippei DSM 8344 TaxID=1121419 RepID=A0A1G8LLY1_9FIRM|nr:hypothetical protein [Desulfosporosinus hippei]SDI56230.1 hypothetical protein SAMN05443529_15013 [Desulfosporosinus hippei DSM 8344]
MANIYWYYLIAIIGLGATVFSIYKKQTVKRSTFLVFYLFTTCITWIGEFFVLGLLDAYAYKTGIFSDPWAQNILGHLILNSTFYPGTAILVAANCLGYGWISFITIIYLLIEYLCLKSGIYEHHWWKYYMTGFLIFFFQVFSKKYFTMLNPIKSRLIRNITFYFVGFVLLHYPIPVLLLLGKQYYNVNWAENLYLSSTMFIFAYQLIEVIILIYCVCILKKWYFKLIPFCIAFFGQYILMKLNILVLKDGWNLLYSMILYFSSIVTFIIIEKYSLKMKVQ